MKNILIIDDEDFIRDIIASRIEEMGHSSYESDTLEQGLELINQHSFDLIFLDVNLPDGNGLEALSKIRQMPEAPIVIIITAFSNAEGAKLAINNGAWDYIEKPIYKDKLMLQIKRALEYKKQTQMRERTVVLSTAGIVGKSTALTDCLDQIAYIASSPVNVLIQGESGTGKELMARMIHDNSSSGTGEYVVVDCASLPEKLIESTLFGYKKGAFTSADKSSEGLIAMAHGGTLFLDEIGELPLSAQKSFLRVLQEKKYRPVGSAKELSSCFRLISATNRNLKQMVDDKTFRADLYHRLKTFVINVPALRFRNGDIKVLAQHYLDKLCTEHQLPPKALLPETITMLENYDWPGNIRELINVIESAILTGPGLELIYPMQLPDMIRISFLEKGFDVKTPATQSHLNPTPLDPGIPVPVFKEYRYKAINEIEHDYFQALLSRCDWDLETAAKQSGLSKNRIYFYIRKFQLKSK
ncbi:sigma-54-dependent transcriptional regulator [Desulfobacter latus]|uniref:Sigma-54-dependent Fis family transcriptional regulator n=1 Tax=Desulfobacter latus TaxID=2292 RepID=A0A850T2S4_9BACT|nr:sigma-54 dependent transcriptional regulator [Desulfobacter latus]NWH06660.1 sigma-54-dependent Fis family transcriptional regulator [Desulfobacter latus]